MADLLNKSVKFSVLGGNVFGTVAAIHEAEFDFDAKKVKATKENPYAIVDLLSGQKTVVATNTLTVISEDELKSDIKALIQDLSAKAGLVNFDTLQTEIDGLKAEITKASASLAEVTKTLETVNAAKAELETKLAESEKGRQALADKLVAIEKSDKAKVRASELKSFEALEVVAATEAEALVKLADMSDELYSAIKSVAEVSFKKLIQARQTVTTASVTEETVEVAEETVEIETVNEVEANLATAATAASDENELMTSHIEGLLSKNKFKKTKKVDNK